MQRREEEEEKEEDQVRTQNFPGRRVPAFNRAATVIVGEAAQIDRGKKKEIYEK